MNIDYLIYDPSGNITVLVKTAADEELRRFISEKIMTFEPSSEQVGFLSHGGLCMAGGEFCGNASMCAAAYYTGEKLKIGEKADAELYVSGTGKVGVSLTRESAGIFSCEVMMPPPLFSGEKSLPTDFGEVLLPVVEFPGISHIIYEGKPEKDTAERYIKKWCEILGADALGIMFTENGKLTPLVYVPSVGTLVWESSCASGTTAAGVYFGKNETLWFKEPGGTLGVSYNNGHPILSGKTELKEVKSVVI